MIGAVTDLEYESGSTTLDSFAKIYIVSDGAYEIEKADRRCGRSASSWNSWAKDRMTAPETSKMDRSDRPRPHAHGQRRFRGRPLAGRADFLTRGGLCSFFGGPGLESRDRLRKRMASCRVRQMTARRFTSLV